MTSTPRKNSLLVPALVSAALAMSSQAAAAQQGNPAGMTPSSQRPAPAPVANTADRLFVQLVGQGGLAEVALGRLGIDRARRGDVQALAQRMIDDHAQANALLDGVARQAGLMPPSQPSAEQQAARSRLASLADEAFDEAFLRQQLVEHQKTVQLLQWEMGSGQDAGLQRLAAQTLPTVLNHLAHVQRLLAAPAPTPH